MYIVSIAHIEQVLMFFYFLGNLWKVPKIKTLDDCGGPPVSKNTIEVHRYY